MQLPPSVGVLQSHSALYTANVGGKAHVIEVGLKQRTDPTKLLHIGAAEGDLSGVKISQLIAGAGAADGVDLQPLNYFKSKQLLFY